MKNARISKLGRAGFAASLSAAALLAGCAMQPSTNFSFTPTDINGKLKSGQYKQKVDSFLVVLDASNTTRFDYKGGGFPEADGEDKFIIEKEFLSRMNQTIPNLKLDYAFRSYGIGPCTDWSYTRLEYPDGHGLFTRRVPG